MNHFSQPIISIIIPTRERADTLSFAIETALDQTNEAYEVMVSDNFSQDNTEEVVQRFSDSRLVYINTGRRLSMCDNWDFALEHARGAYVIFIGDDDGVLPGSLDKLQQDIQRYPSLVYCWPRPTYVWPAHGQRAYVSYLPANTGLFRINLEKLARFAVSLGGTRYSFLPSAYHAAVAKSILDKIRKQTGRVFHTTQPDIFTAFAVPAFSRTAINVGYPVTVAGQSMKSNSAVVYGEEGIKVQERFIEEYGGYRIHSTLFPDITMRANLLADTILVAMDRFPQFYGRMKFNYEAMWAYMLQEASFFKWPVDWRKVMQKRQHIRHYHGFSAIRFLYYYALQETANIYRKICKAKMQLSHFQGRTPENVSEFVKQLASGVTHK